MAGLSEPESDSDFRSIFAVFLPYHPPSRPLPRAKYLILLASTRGFEPLLPP